VSRFWQINTLARIERNRERGRFFDKLVSTLLRREKHENTFAPEIETLHKQAPFGIPINGEKTIRRYRQEKNSNPNGLIRNTRGFFGFTLCQSQPDASTAYLSDNKPE
jgi:hypothetical protein